MHQKVPSPAGRAIYARRKVIVEPVFGPIKQALGFRRFSLRGLAKAAAEWGLVCLCHNVLKLYRAAPRWLTAEDPPSGWAGLRGRAKHDSPKAIRGRTPALRAGRGR